MNSNFIILFLCLVLGVAFQKVKRFPANTAQALNQFVIFISLPALILARFPQLLRDFNPTGHWWIPVSMAWGNFFLAWLLISWLAKKYNWSPAKKGALILTVGLGNTSFVGFPLLEALIGKEAIPVGILADQLGSFLIVSTLGLFVAAQNSGGNPGPAMMAKRILGFPPFLAVLTAVIWTLLGRPGENIWIDPLEKIASTLVPLALFAVGFQTQFQWKIIQKRRFPLMVGLSLKLILLPAFFYVLFVQTLGVRDLFSHVAILEAAMATQITSAVVAAEFNLDTELANLMVGLGIPLSLLTVPVWHQLLS